jgi:hypothetical protein
VPVLFSCFVFAAKTPPNHRKNELKPHNTIIDSSRRLARSVVLHSRTFVLVLQDVCYRLQLYVRCSFVYLPHLAKRQRWHVTHTLGKENLRISVILFSHVLQCTYAWLRIRAHMILWAAPAP